MPARRSGHLGLAAVLFVLVLPLALLGRWQLERAEENRAQSREHDAAGDRPALSRPPAHGDRYRRAELVGRFLPARQVLLDNMTRSGRVGYEVLTPFLLGDGAVVLVNRGWLQASGDRERTPDVGVGSEVATIRGRFDRLPQAAIALGEPDVDTLEHGLMRISYPSIPLLEKVLELELAPLQLKLDAGATDGYELTWAMPGALAERNVAYAVQWFALALAAAAGGIVLVLRGRVPTDRATQ